MTEPTPVDREPVLAAGKIAGAVAGAILAVGALLKTLTLLPVGVDVDRIASESGNVVLAFGVLWALGGPWLLARLQARDKVTPLVDARDEHGLPFYTAKDVARLLDEAEAKARAQALEQARDEYHAALARAGQLAPADGEHADPSS